jgi:hypothetical protein
MIVVGARGLSAALGGYYGTIDIVKGIFMKQTPKVTVNIKVTGDVINSQITGVHVEYTNHKSKTYKSSSLLAKVLVEYLGLPSLQELSHTFDVWRSRRKGTDKTCKRVNELWFGLGYPGYLYDPVLTDLTAVTLNNVQIIEFINRNPGYPFRGGTGYTDESWTGLNHKSPILTPSFSWVELRQLRHRTVSMWGLGDIRFSESEDGSRLLSVVSAPTRNWAEDIDRPRQVTGSDLHRSTLRPWSEPKKQSPPPYELGERLIKHTQLIEASSYNVDEISLGGFPLLLTRDVFSDLADILHKYGAVAVDQLTGVLVKVPEWFPISYTPGFPKWCLLVGRRTHLKGIHQPQPVVCSAWTVSVEKDSPAHSEEQYLQWMFKVGVDDWQQQMERAIEVIQLVKNKVNALALFEFDEERNWFDAYTEFTPRSMRRMFKNLTRRKNSFSVSFESGAEDVQTEE